MTGDGINKYCTDSNIWTVQKVFVSSSNQEGGILFCVWALKQRESLFVFIFLFIYLFH